MVASWFIILCYNFFSSPVEFSAVTLCLVRKMTACPPALVFDPEMLAEHLLCERHPATPGQYYY